MSGGYVSIAPRGTVIQSTVDATWASQVLEAHNARRTHLGLRGPAIYRSPYDTNPDLPPPALQEDRPASSSRWESRFRHGPPPPPPPPPITENMIARILQASGLDPADPHSPDLYAQGVQDGRFPPIEQAREILGMAQTRKASQLRLQAEFDLKIGTYQRPTRPGSQHARPTKPRPPLPFFAQNGQRPTLDRERSWTPQPVMEAPTMGTPSGPPEAPPLPNLPDAMAQPDALTPSQRRRLRRKRQRISPGGPLTPPQLVPDDIDIFPQLPAPYTAPPLTPEQRANGVAPHTNGVYPTASEADPQSAPPTPSPECGHVSRVFLPDIGPGGQWLELACTVTLRPHPGQPHLISVPAAYLDGAQELFIGWYGPGE